MLRKFLKKDDKKNPTIKDYTATCIIECKEHCTKVVLSTNQTTSLLDALIDQDVPIPYGCRNAACRSCVTKIISGSVHMKKQYVLSEKDLKDNYILTCCSYLNSKEQLHIIY